MSRSQDRQGKAGQNIARVVLRSAGIGMVEQIATPVKLIPARVKGTYKVIWGEPVSGDHRGIMPNGKSVLAETKTILDRNLRYSDLREHQPDRLDEHHQYNGISLLVWVHLTGTYVMRWPINGFTKGTSIDPETAEELHNLCMSTIER